MTIDRDEALWLHAQARITIVELAQCSGVGEDVLRELVEYGALAPVEPGAEDFSARYVATVRAAARLAADLELETAALALVISFLERIDVLEARVRELDAKRPR